MSEAKRPRLEIKTKLGSEAWQCFIRHYSRCYQKMQDSSRVRKDNLVKATLLSRNSIYAVQSIFRGLNLENKLGKVFEIHLNYGLGARFRFSDSITFSLLHLAIPSNFRICGTFRDIKNYTRIDQLVSLSKNATELVAFEPVHDDNFILLLQSMGQHLNFLLCDPVFLACSEVPTLNVNVYKFAPTKSQVLLRDILRHRIQCLDLRNDTSGACITDDECPTQPALEKLIVRGCFFTASDLFDYFQDVHAFAPNLKTYEVEFSEELTADQMTAVACTFSHAIWSKFMSLVKLADKCRGNMEFLTIRAKVSGEIPTSKTKYETNWTDQVQASSSDYQFQKSIETDLNGRNESVQIRIHDDFLNLLFKANLSVLAIPEWNDNLLFARLNT